MLRLAARVFKDMGCRAEVLVLVTAVAESPAKSEVWYVTCLFCLREALFQSWVQVHGRSTLQAAAPHLALP